MNARLRNTAGRSPLLLASFEGHAGIVAALLDDARGAATLNVTDTHYSATPLHAAVLRGHLAVVDLLLQHHGDARYGAVASPVANDDSVEVSGWARMT
jgi:ankyrin repeat protein